MKKILVVDDSLTMRRIIVNVVKQIGIDSDNIFEASDGVQAFKIIEKEEFDVILTDWNMPNMNGLALVHKIRQSDNINKNKPIIMITTEGGKGEVITALKTGVNNYIVKPFGADVLKDKLKPFF